MRPGLAGDRGSTEKLFRLDERVALLTGAAGHLGTTMAWSLAEAGASVVLVGRTDKVSLLAERMKTAGLSAESAIADITSEDGRAALIRQVEARHGRLDVLVNNAYAGRTGTVHTSTTDDFAKAYDITVISAFRMAILALPLLEEAAKASSGGAAIINIASMYGIVSPDPSIYSDSRQSNPPHYGAAKAGLIQLTRYLACHLAASRVRVNCISPGAFPSDQSLQDEQFRERLGAKAPLHRTGHPDELRGPLLFLASDASSFVTGANLIVDGGWTAW